MTPKDLSGLELRKALAIALEMPWAKHPAVDWASFPAYESDATLSEELLDRECRKRGWAWSVISLPSISQYTCHIEHAVSADLIGDGQGSNPSESRCRALLQALGTER